LRQTAASTPRSLIHLQHRQKCFLRNLDAADFLHALFAFLLFLEQLALARDVAAVGLMDVLVLCGFRALLA
jgi:hypothetical protein